MDNVVNRNGSPLISLPCSLSLSLSLSLSIVLIILLQQANKTLSVERECLEKEKGILQSSNNDLQSQLDRLVNISGEGTERQEALQTIIGVWVKWREREIQLESRFLSNISA